MVILHWFITSSVYLSLQNFCEHWSFLILNQNISVTPHKVWELLFCCCHQGSYRILWTYICDCVFCPYIQCCFVRRACYAMYLLVMKRSAARSAYHIPDEVDPLKQLDQVGWHYIMSNRDTSTQGGHPIHKTIRHKHISFTQLSGVFYYCLSIVAYYIICLWNICINLMLSAS